MEGLTWCKTYILEVNLFVVMCSFVKLESSEILFFFFFFLIECLVLSLNNIDHR